MEDGKLHPVIYETDKLFLFHHINSFEQDGELIVDVAGYDSDTVTGTKTDWFVGEGFLASEPTFVADPTKSNPDEDDGVILTTLLQSKQPTYVALVVLDAKTMKEIARSEFTAAGAVTFTHHGIWTPTARD
ncbi:unnamed protein product [Orchesella dallaii]|uniref:Uncharacterized protein n=1 Tax=Orchesella dallaii TaxID=48710 RepID=A0ABP1QRU2_9HEXA